MKIKVRDKDTRFTLFLPNCLIFGGLVTKVVSAVAKEKDIKLTSEQIREICAALKQARRDFGKLRLVDVRAKNGDIVEITL